MKILQINNSYPFESTGKIVACIHEYLITHGVQSIVCYERGNKTKNINVYRLVGCEYYVKLVVLINRLLGLQYKGSWFYTKRLISIIKNEKPDIIHIHCINGGTIDIYSLLSFLNYDNIPVLLTCHAEFFYTGSCGHAFDCNQWKHGCEVCPCKYTALHSYLFDRSKEAWNLMNSSIGKFSNTQMIITTVSPWMKYRAENSDIFSSKQITSIMNPVNKNIYKCMPSEIRSKIRQELKIDEKTKLIFYVTASYSPQEVTLKGGHFIPIIADKLKNENVHIVIAAGISTKAENSSNLTILGNIIDQNRLAQIYNAADVTLITSKRETFSMICAESLMCGTPVVGFKAGGPESIATQAHSEFVEYGDIDALCNVIKNLPNNVSFKCSDIISQEAINKFDQNLICEQYFSLYNKLQKSRNYG